MNHSEIVSFLWGVADLIRDPSWILTETSFDRVSLHKTLGWSGR